MANITTKDKKYAERANYVNDVLSNTFKPIEDIKSVRYAVSDTSKEIVREIIRVESWLGMTAYLDVTALSEAQILRSIIHLTIAEGEPKNLITDADTVRKVARMF